MTRDRILENFDLWRVYHQPKQERDWREIIGWTITIGTGFIGFMLSSFY